MHPITTANLAPRTSTKTNHNPYLSDTTKSSFDGTYSAASVTVTLSIALSLYNALELLLLILSTFKRWRGLYFWSLCACTFGVFCYALGILLTYFDLCVLWFGKVVDDVGWVCMVAAQSVVLYSRLNLILDSPTILRCVKWMIVATSSTILPMVVVLDFGSTYSDRNGFFEGYYYIEQIQLIVVGVQELVISGLYVWKAVALLKVLEKKQTRRVVWQLFAINVMIISMDVVIIALEFLHYQLYQEALKGVFYSIKLKLELNILSKLVDLVSGGNVRNRSNTLEVIDADAITSPQPGTLHRDFSEQDMRDVQQKRQIKGELGAWSPNGYDEKGRLREDVTERPHGDGGICRFASREEGGESSSSPSKDGDEKDQVGDEIMRMAALSQQETYSSSRTRGRRESDIWYAEALRAMK